MPITKSAKKSLRVSRTKQAINRTNIVTYEKALRQADAKNVNEVVSLVDKAAKTGLIHKNKAARIKSGLAKKFGTPKVEKTATAKVTPSGKTAVSKKGNVKRSASPKRASKP